MYNIPERSLEKINLFDKLASSEDMDYLNSIDSAKTQIVNLMAEIAPVDDLESEYKILDVMLLKFIKLERSKIESVFNKKDGPEYERD